MPSPAWYNNIWPYRFKITPSAVNADLYYDLSLAPAAFWDHVRSDGGDIRVTKEDGTTEVAREISGFSLVNKKGSLYLATAGGTAFYVYYGVASATEPYAGSTYGSQGVWGSAAKYIGHFAGNANDSSANAKNGTVTGAVQVDGKLLKAYQFDGIDDKISIGSGANDYDNGLVIALWLKNYKNSLSANNTQAESTTGNSTGDNTATHRRGRQGIDTAGGTLVDWVLENDEGSYGSRFITIYGYQDDTSVVAGTFQIIDETTSTVLASGDLGKIGSGATDKRMNSPYIVEPNGHPIRVKVFFSNTTNLYIDYLVNGRSGYDGIIQKGGDGYSFGVNTNNVGGERAYINTAGTVGNTGNGYLADTWQRYILVYNETNCKVYLDGVLKSTVAKTGNINQTTNAIILGEWNNGFNFWGEMCEVWLRDDPQNWDQTRVTNDYANFSSPSTFWTTGNIETKSTSTVQRDSGFGIRTTSITSKPSSFGIGRTEQVQKGSSFGIKRTMQLAHDAGLAILRLSQIVKDSAFTIGRSSSVQKSSSFAVLNTDRVTKFSGFAIKRYPFKQRTSPLSARSGIFTPKSRIINPLPPFDENN